MANNIKTTRQIVAYFRVSTQSQGEAGNGLEAQREAVGKWAESKGYQIQSEFTEIESGRKTCRPQLSSAIQECRDTGAVLVVAKLDRLARNLSFISRLLDSPVQFAALDMPALDDPDVSRLVIQQLAAIAEFESARISRRTRDALAQVSKKKKLGSPTPKNGAIASGKARSDAALQHTIAIWPKIERLRARKIVSYRSIAAELNAWAVPLRESASGPVIPDLINGPRWSAQHVKNIHLRAKQAGLISA
jgi:DNA invertase Pin-like site-specific DNA recombinase